MLVELDGGPAFPDNSGPGMTLLDWFAGMALQGLLMRGSGSITNTAQYGEAAYRLANVMIENKGKQTKSHASGLG